MLIPLPIAYKLEQFIRPWACMQDW